jgi:hypothetical protein
MFNNHRRLLLPAPPLNVMAKTFSAHIDATAAMTGLLNTGLKQLLKSFQSLMVRRTLSLIDRHCFSVKTGSARSVCVKPAAPKTISPPLGQFKQILHL